MTQPETIRFRAIRCNSAHDAIQWSEASGGGEAVMLDGQCYVMQREVVERLGAAGVAFAWLFDHEIDNGEHRIVAVPIN